MRLQFMRLGSIFILAMFFSPETFSAERSLPRGESSPQYIVQIFASPRGEMQILETSEGGTTAFLRDAKGNLLGLNEVRGSRFCDEWLISRKQNPPGGCSFIFHDQDAGKYVRVDSEELEEASLFEAVRGMMRGKHVAL